MANGEHDVVVVGSGAGGAAAAWALTTGGAKVLLLEAGPAYNPAADYRLDRDDWERTAFPAKVQTRGRHVFVTMQLLEDRWSQLRSWNKQRGQLVTGERRAVLGYHHVVGLGGSTLHFTGEMHRLHPASMQMRTRFGVASDWPFSYDEIEPLYLELERLIGVAGPEREPSRPRSAPYPLPPHKLSYASQKLQAGFRKLGLNYGPNARAALSQPYDDRPDCNYCGGCMRGCPRLDKGSADLTYLRHAERTGRLAIETEAAAVAIEAGEDDRIRGVVYRDRRGAQQRTRTRAVVLACGAIETPRLLLASSVGNESGLVGRNLMETVAWGTAGLHPEPLGSHRGLPADGICWDHNAPDTQAGMIGGCRYSHATHEADLMGPIAYAQRVVGGFGRAHKSRMRQTFGRVLSVGAVGESLPNGGTFVDLDPARRDNNGVPLARIHARVDDDTARRLAFMAKTCRAALEAAGVVEIIEAYGSYDAFSATHVFGTCRMGKDAKAHVVDPFCRHHRWRNLYIADASVFPSSGGGESPALTIGVLAVRAARNLLDRGAVGDL
jgi:choline dehydrogenase-like flavoprotein